MNATDTVRSDPEYLTPISDLWKRLLEIAPAEQTPVLLLRREGYSLAKIAEHTGLSEAAVNHILRELVLLAARDPLPAGAPAPPANAMK